MPERLQEGDRIPFFHYDTPYSAHNRFRTLAAEHAPLTVVFMGNFGHPVTRTFVKRYAETRRYLVGGGFALVVRSRADRLAGVVGPDTLPFPLLCDAAGVLYDRFDIPQRRGALTTYSLEGWRIMSAAKRQGYHPDRDALQQLPLTLILDADGTVLFSHYGASLTDVPADCEAVQLMLEELELAPVADDLDFPDEEDDPAAPLPARRLAEEGWDEVDTGEAAGDDEADEDADDEDAPDDEPRQFGPNLGARLRAARGAPDRARDAKQTAPAARRLGKARADADPTDTSNSIRLPQPRRTARTAPADDFMAPPALAAASVTDLFDNSYDDD